jgi:hypothetical protein
MSFFSKKLVYIYFFVSLLTPFVAQAEIERTLWESSNRANDLFWGGQQDEFETASGLGTMSMHPSVAVANIINFALGFMGILATAIIVLTGFKWMLSGGNEDKIAECKKTLIGTVVGSIIIFSSFSVVQFFLDAVYDATLI